MYRYCLPLDVKSTIYIISNSLVSTPLFLFYFPTPLWVQYHLVIIIVMTSFFFLDDTPLVSCIHIASCPSIVHRDNRVESSRGTKQTCIRRKKNRKKEDIRLGGKLQPEFYQVCLVNNGLTYTFTQKSRVWFFHV